MKPLYVETTVRCAMSDLWRRTQDPASHERWDLRFTRITYLPSDGDTAPSAGQAASPRPSSATTGDGRGRRFRYATTILPGLTIEGIGVTAGERARPDGTCTSALRFATDHPLSMIETGSGYWRYVPAPAGIRFLTGYDYRPRFAHADWLFRPLLGWATAWSFDRLRLWLEDGITPRRGLLNAIADLCARIALVLLAATLAPWVTAHVVAWAVTVMMAVAVSVAPPLRTTPAARRCLRRPPDRLAGKAPSTLDSLELT